MTAERLVASREAAQAPLREAEQAHANAVQRVTEALAVLEARPTTSPRLDAALAAKAAADAAVVGKSAERGCAINCRTLLQAQVDSALREVAAARAEMATATERAALELADARAALAALKAPTSPTPLADRLGAAPWVIDLIAAALGSMAANGLGCGLIAFAGHGHREGVGALEPGGQEPLRLAKAVPVEEHAAQFALDALSPSRRGAADLLAIHQAYRRWCAEKGIDPLPVAEIGAALAQLLGEAGITLEERAGKRVAVGIGVKTHMKRKALGHMVTIGTA